MNDKAKILRVGMFLTRHASPSLGIAETTVEPYGWHFDCLGYIPPVDCRDGVVRWGGYTLDELHEIASRPAEFVEVQ